MHKFILIFVVAFFCNRPYLQGQEVSTSPDINNMFRNGVKYEVAGDYPTAIVTYNQLLKLEPNNQLVTYQLATLHYRNADYKNAIDLLKPLANDKMQKEEVYQLLAAAYSAEKNYKKALTTITKGIKLFPNSGLLYQQQGRTQEMMGNNDDAFLAYCNGITHAPYYASNYKQAASCTTSAPIVWQLIYEETYILLKKDTTGNTALKNDLFTHWKLYYTQLGSQKNEAHLSAFEKKVNSIHLKTTPTISNGYTIANLAKARAEAITEWSKLRYESELPFYLFDWHLKLANNNLLSVYFKWVMGANFDASKEEHADFSRLMLWMKNNTLKISAHEGYMSH